jgi:iron complex outermembrane recepter protein
MIKTFLLLVTILLTSAAIAQSNTGSLKIMVTNEQEKPLEAVTIELLKKTDSSLVKTAISDNYGDAEFTNIPAGVYVTRISGVGYSTQYSNTIIIDEKNTNNTLPVIRLKAAQLQQMQAVTVTAKKPFIQRLNDRIVVNVDNSIVNAGNSALEVLEKSPGITIDQDDVVSLRGKTGVTIMIDGKPSPMTGADLANYLKALPANAIDRIEIITNPSAKYDAAGNSGIIDIKMKKDQRLGYNGSVNLSYSQGIYPKSTEGITFNYRNSKLNVFGNYNHSQLKLLNNLYINRNFYDNGVFKGSDDKVNRASLPLTPQNGRIGADYYASKNTIIGFVVSSNYNHFQRVANINTIVNDVNYNPAFSFSSVGTNNDHNNNTIGNLNFRQKLNGAGKEISADIDYGIFNTSSLTRTSSNFYNLDGTKRKEDDILDGDQQGRLVLKTAKMDYVNPLKNGNKYEAGFKTSYVSSDKDAKFYNVFTTGSEVDETKTNHFFYEEYNNAAYVNYSKEAKKFNLQLGLRGEQTNIITHQVKGDKRFKDDYFQLFPSAFFNYKIEEDKTLGVSVSRRIDRPGYSQLDPFLFQVDATIYATGNPFLKPQTTWSYEMNYTVKNMNFSLSYSNTKKTQNVVLSKILDVIPTFEIKPGQDSNITVQIPVNLISSDYVGFTATTPLHVTKWWNMVNNLTIYYNHFNGDLGGTTLNNGSPAANMKVNNNFSLENGWSAELNGMVNSGGRDGYMVMQPAWELSTGVQKAILKNKGTLKFTVNDIFWTNLPHATVTYEGSYVEHWHAERDSRKATLAFIYRFGNSKMQAARNRSTGSEEERQRAGGN